MMKQLQTKVWAVLFVLLSLITLTRCRIEPPLHLPGEELDLELPIVINSVDVVWDVQYEVWSKMWYYGWDDNDVRLWGPIEYPEPTNFEVRRYFLGETPGVPHTEPDEFTIYNRVFRRRYYYGYYDLLLYSNIDAPDHAQVLKIDDKSDYDRAIATTTTRSMSFLTKGQEGSYIHYNQPEIFYACEEKGIYISPDMNAYEWDPVNKFYYMRINTTLNPRVYIYLVQVLLHNNKGRIDGLEGNCAVNGLASYTNVNTGHTGYEDNSVLFGMGIKKHIIVESEDVDILGGKLTTFGLCDMPAYNMTKRSKSYNGTRVDVKNNVALNLSFNNSTDSTYFFDVTDQFQSHPYGGIITLHINVDDIKIPVNPNPPSGGGGLFDPRTEEYKDTIAGEFSM